MGILFKILREILKESNFLCPRLDSNQHVLADTTPSRWRVYQFHHMGQTIMSKIKKVKH